MRFSQSHTNAHLTSELLSDGAGAKKRDKKWEPFNHSAMFAAKIREQDEDLITFKPGDYNTLDIIPACIAWN